MVEQTTIAIQVYSRAELEAEEMLLIYGADALGNTILKIAKLTC